MRKKQKNWVRRRHKAIFAILRCIFGVHAKIRYNFRAIKCQLKPPFLLMGNHTTALDPVFASLSFKCPIYYCATDDLFNIPVATPLLKYLVAPIPKMKSGMDMHAIRDCLRVLKEGGAVGIFPEGNRTLSGGQWQMTDAVAKFVKMSKATLVLYNIEGGYGSDPRWGTTVRKGKMHGYVKATLTYDEYKEMPNEELFNYICANLTVNDVASGVRFKSRRRAENIERALYMCPHCGAISSIVSKGAQFKCANCGSAWEYTEDLRIAPSDVFPSVYEWYEWERGQLAQLAKTAKGDILTDDKIEFYKSSRDNGKRRLDGNKVSADSEGVTVLSKEDATKFLYKDMSGFAIVRKNKFEFYIDGETYQIAGDDKFCSVKYLHLYEEVKNVSFLGL